jgi:ATP-dependent Clp protease adaptor protein ClpS
MSERFEREEGVVTETRDERKLARPRMFKVLLHNDDYTTREFVVEILIAVFHKKENEAIAIMLNVHQKGVGVAGIYTREVAETKVRIVEQLARSAEFPLRLSIEPEE